MTGFEPSPILIFKSVVQRSNHFSSDCSCQTTAKLCNLCEEHINVINTVADPDPNPVIGGQLPNRNEWNSTLTSETRGETLTPNPNECHSTLTSETRGETLTPNPNECQSMLTSAIRGIYHCLYIYIYIELQTHVPILI